MKKILVVGGYGTVGLQIADMLHKRYPQYEMYLGGRNPEKAKKQVGINQNYHVVKVDNDTEDPLAESGDDWLVIINAVNDLGNHLLKVAVRKGIPFVDITRWTEKFHEAQKLLEDKELAAPVVLASGWMAGIASLLASLYVSDLQDVQKININALYSVKDKAGPNSVEYMDRMSIPFTVTEAGKSVTVEPMTDPEKVIFPNGYETNCFRLDTPDHFTLVETVKAKSAHFRIAFDDKPSTYFLYFLVNSGIWKLIHGERYKGLRRKLLYRPGKGHAHHLVLTIQGNNRLHKPTRRTISVTDPQGQTHLTAAGATLQAIGLIEKERKGGIYYPEDARIYLDEAFIREFLFAHDIIVKETAILQE